jgi:uncharacterized protein (TIGR03067 family)
MRTLTLLAAAVLTAGFAPAPFPRPSKTDRKTDLQKLEGSWVLASCTVDGVQLRSYGELTMVVRGSSATYYRGTEVERAFTLTLSGARGRGFWDSRGTAGASLGLSYECLYHLEGDTLKVAYHNAGEKRPASIERSRPGLYLDVYKRAR